MSQQQRVSTTSWWKNKKIIIWIVVIAVLVVILVILITAAQAFHWQTGFTSSQKTTTITEVTQPSGKTVTTTIEDQPAKTLWDWLPLLIQLLGALAIPIVIWLGTSFFTRQQAKTSEANTENQQQEEFLRTYFDKISDLLLDKELSTHPNMQSIVRARTLAALHMLNPERKTIVLRFLYDSSIKEHSNLLQYIKGFLYSLDLSNTDLHGIDLCEADLSRTNLSQADLSRTNLSQADLSRAFLVRADLSRANLIDADLNGADLSRANLSGADLSKTNLISANLSGADLGGVRWLRAFLLQRNLPNSFVQFNTLFEDRLLRIEGANPHAAKLSRANLSGADLSRAFLVGADLSGADLSRADLISANLRYTNLSGADLSSANLSRADLSGADLSKTDLSYTKLSRAKLYYANLSGTDLRGADLSRASITTEQLKKARNITSEQIAQIKLSRLTAKQEAKTEQASTTPIQPEIKPDQTNQEDAKQQERIPQSKTQMPPTEEGESRKC